MLNLVYDRQVIGRPYPNLAPLLDAKWGFQGLGDQHPFICPLRLYYYAQDHKYSINISYIDQPLPDSAFYPVGISWFDFSLDFFELMSDQVRDYLRSEKLCVLFYYHEGDNPAHEKTRLDELCAKHQLPNNCYCFVSGNTAANNIENFIYFADHELFYWRNAVVWNKKPQIGCEPHPFKRNKEFTCLSRVHKWWRAAIMTYLNESHVLNNSYWSYGNVDIGDLPQDNPIQISKFSGLESCIDNFLKHSPYKCDDLDQTEHNSHWMFVPEHFSDSYCHIVLETFFDADGSNGCFISEKVFKPIRHGQPFVVFGPRHTLKTLRELGYRTYDHAIDTSYDDIEDNTERFIKAVDAIKKIKKQDMHAWYMSMWEDIQHNRELYLSSQDKNQKLDNLVKNILAHRTCAQSDQHRLDC
jgi:hypothetical protein